MMRIVVCLLSIICAIVASAITSSDVNQAYTLLDNALAHRNDYIHKRQAHIDSLLQCLSAKSADSASIIMKIGDAYTGFNNDSALSYLNRGANNLPYRQSLPFKWKRASLLPLNGMFDWAIQSYAAIDSSDVPRELLASYYDAGRQMHSYIAAFFRSYPSIAASHDSLANDYQLKMLNVLPQESQMYRYNIAEYNFLIGNTSTAKVLLEEFLDAEPATSNYRARAAHHLSTLAMMQNEDKESIYYLAISACADVIGATREVVSLQELGYKAYADGDISRAHRYLSTALANAVECGAPLRMIDTSRSLTIIERAHSNYLAANRRTIYIIMCIMAMLLIALGVIMFVLRHEMHKMSKLQSTLQAANSAKEVYISQFLQLCSIYMDKLNQFCKIATRKLAAGQADELYRMTKSGRFVEEQSREFYDVFDNAFLHIYPDFVTQVNALLRPDAQIELQHGELMNTDLRILAFLRLGIEESSRIAQILNYSLNTIYSYRNRLKARAINRETFESDIMKIDSAK